MDHVVDVLSIYQRIVTIRRVGMERGEFHEGTFGRAIVEAMIFEARHAL